MAILAANEEDLAEAKAKAEAEVRAKAEAAARAKQQAAEKAKREAELKARAEQEAKQKAEEGKDAEAIQWAARCNFDDRGEQEAIKRDSAAVLEYLKR